MSQLDGVEVNGHPTQRYAGNMNLSFAYVEGESLIMGLKVRFDVTDATTLSCPIQHLTRPEMRTRSLECWKGSALS